jgi:PEP-CTERM motif
LLANGGVPGWIGINNEMEIDFTPILSPGVGTQAYDGKQSTEIDATIQQITQTITGLTPGEQYTLSWAYGLRPGLGFQAMDVSFGGNLVTHDSGTAGPLGTALIWEANSFTVTASAISEDLTFTEVAGTPNAGNELDAVSLVATVPEPSSLVLLATLVVLGVLCFRGRRKPRVASQS